MVIYGMLLWPIDANQATEVSVRVYAPRLEKTGHNIRECNYLSVIWRFKQEVGFTGAEKMKKKAMAFVLLKFLSVLYYSNTEEAFDVCKHLSTVSRYGVVKDIADTNFIPSNIPQGCIPIHLNLVARHGTRSPTKKRIRELDNLSARLEVLIRDAKERNLPLERVPSWLNGWKSPWQGRLNKGGELIRKGEEELYDLGIRIREKFPNLFDEEYHLDIYPIKATQVPRASASAVAFGMGLFGGNGSLEPGHHRAFAVTSESRASDILLRFYDCCHNYRVCCSHQ